MAKENLKKSIRKLRAEVEQLDAQKSGVKTQMEALLGELEEEVNNSGKSDRTERLTEKVKAFIAEYEVKHPSLATALEEILWTLSNMGI